MDSAPGDPLAPLQRGEGWGEGRGGLAADPHPAPHPNLLPAGGEKGRLGGYRQPNRPEIPAQPIDIMDSAPGNPIAAEAPGGADAERGRSRASAPAVPLGSPRRQSPSQDGRLQRPSAARDDVAETGVEPGALALLGRDNRPEIPAQPIDIMDSAPGNPIAAEAAGGADAERGRSRASAPAVPLGSPRRKRCGASPPGNPYLDSECGNPIASPGRRGRGARPLSRVRARRSLGIATPQAPQAPRRVGSGRPTWMRAPQSAPGRRRRRRRARANNSCAPRPRRPSCRARRDGRASSGRKCRRAPSKPGGRPLRPPA